MFYPVVMDASKFPESNFHVMNMLSAGYHDNKTDIVVINLKGGEVKGPFETRRIFSLHHVNAYETNNDRVVLDLTPAPFDGVKEYFRLSNVLNPPKKGSKEAGKSTTEGKEVTRISIDVEIGNVEITNFENPLNSKFVNNFDFPTINEDYRGKEYCYVYGVSIYGYSRTALVKKDVCNSREDKVWYQEDHYASEMSFIPNPKADKEDNGVLITLIFDGLRKQSYVMLLDAETFRVINKLYLPHNIPWSAHGLHFPEATFPVNLKN